MILVEARKVWKKQMFIKLLLCMLVLSFGLKWYQMQYLEAYPSSAYAQLSSEIEHLDEEEKEQFFIAAIARSETMAAIDAIFVTENKDTSSFTTEDVQAYESGVYPHYTNTNEEDLAFLKEQQQVFQKIHDYGTMREEIAQRAQQMQTTTLFQNNPDTMVNIIKTAQDYAQIETRSLSYHVNKGFSVAFQDSITFTMVLLMLFPLVYLLFFEECESGLLYLMKSTPKGRWHTMLAKLIVLAGSVFILLLLFYGESWLFSILFYPPYDVHVPLQSISYFLASTTSASIAAYLFLFFIGKWLMCYLLALLFVFLLFKTKHIAISVFLLFIFFILEYVAYIFLLPTGRFLFFKYVNIYTWLDVHILYAEYHNLVLFHQVLSLRNISIGIALAVIVLLWFHNIHHFQTHKEIYQHKQHIHLTLPFHVHSLTYYSFYKVLWSQKTLFIFAAFFCFLLQSIQIPKLSSHQLYQKSYIEELYTMNDEQREHYLLNKQQYFEDLQIKVEEINNQQKEGKFAKAEASALRANMEMQLRAYPAFQDVKERYETAKQDGVELLFEDGYQRLFQTYPKDAFIFLLCVLILCIPPAVCMDKRPSMHLLLGSFPLGREKRKQKQWHVYAFLCVLLYLSIVIKELYEVIQSLGLPAITSPLRTLSFYRDVSFPISILQFYFLGCVLRITMMLCFAWMIYLLSLHLAKLTHIYLVSTLWIFAGTLFQMIGFACGGWDICQWYQLPYASSFSWWLLYPYVVLLLISAYETLKKHHFLAFLEKIRYTNSK